MVAYTPLSRSLAPALAYRYHAGIVSGATAVSFHDIKQNPVWGKAVCDGSVLEEYRSVSEFSIVTVHSGIYKVPPHKNAAGRMEKIDFGTMRERCVLTELKRFVQNHELSPEDAEIVVAGGRGVGDPSGFKLIHELAEALGGAVAAYQWDA